VVVCLLCVSAAHAEVVFEATYWQMRAAESHRIIPHYSSIACFRCRSALYFFHFAAATQACLCVKIFTILFKIAVL